MKAHPNLTTHLTKPSGNTTGSFNFHSTKTFGLDFRQLSVANGTALGKISKKEENLSRYTQIFGNFPEVFFPFNFVP